MRFAKLVSAAAVAALMMTAAAQAACPGPAGFKKWLGGVKKEAFARGVTQETWQATAPYLYYDEKIVALDRKQNVFAQSFLEFSGRMANANRLARGKSQIAKYKNVFARIEKTYGVPAPVIASFWGLETDFGANTGNLPVLTSLATLAYDCRRPEKFRPQLIAGLLLAQTGELQLEEMVGAWAGEIGQAQFMPGDYLEKAVDFDGDGRRDLRRSTADALASTANFMRLAGWKKGQPWLQEVRVPQKLPWEKADLKIYLPRAQWAKWGVQTAAGKPLPADKVPVALLLPMGRKGPAFLAYPNFKAYIAWNESLLYSTTAAYFATRLAGAPAAKPGSAEPFGYKLTVELQKILAKRGYDVGKIDGKIGAGTRAAVKDVQLKLGLPADSYPTAELLEMLRSGA
jgi:lytic murein transglycosylase